MGQAEPKLLNYKEERKRQAMLGLRYADGNVSVVPEDAKLVVGGKDEEASRASRSLALAAIEENLAYDAIQHATRAVLLDPASAPNYLTLGQALLTKRLVPEASAAFATGFGLDPTSVELSFAWADALSRGDQRQRAIDQFEVTLRLDSKHVRARERLAIQAYYLGQYERAWLEVHAVEALGHAVPPQFRVLLSESSPEPKR